MADPDDYEVLEVVWVCSGCESELITRGEGFTNYGWHPVPFEEEKRKGIAFLCPKCWAERMGAMTDLIDWQEEKG